jgi:hypothetical protein
VESKALPAKNKFRTIALPFRVGRPGWRVKLYLQKNKFSEMALPFRVRRQGRRVKLDMPQTFLAKWLYPLGFAVEGGE